MNAIDELTCRLRQLRFDHSSGLAWIQERGGEFVGNVRIESYRVELPHATVTCWWTADDGWRTVKAVSPDCPPAELPWENVRDAIIASHDNTPPGGWGLFAPGVITGVRWTDPAFQRQGEK